MNSETPVKISGCFKWLVLSIIFLICVSIVMPSTIICGETGAISGLMGNAKNLMVSVKLFADDHGGKYPDTLQDLVKEGVIEPLAFDKLLAHPTEGPKTPLGWIYLPDLNDDTAADHPVLISPILKDDSGPVMRRLKALMGQRPRLPVKPVRVVAFNDTSVELLKESDFQALLKKHDITLPTVEALNTP